MSVAMRFLRDPLFHFLMAGLAIFLVFSVVNPRIEVPEGTKRIVVDRDTLLTFLQYRMKAFNPERASRTLNEMPEDRLETLIKDYVRQEALFKESTALGLGQNDYIIKQRMIKKIDFISQGFAKATVKVSDDDVEEFFSQNKERYKRKALITFTHVFIEGRNRTKEQLVQLANEKLIELRATNAAFSDAPRHGDHFPHGLNHVERTPDHVAGQFGNSMTQALFRLDGEENVWHGPIESPYGLHLVMVAGKKDASYPPLDEVRDRVLSDITQQKRKEESDKAIAAIVDTYEVEVNLDEIQQIAGLAAQ